MALKMKELRLSLMTKWFQMTKLGIKTEDYREINEYWFKRLVLNWGKVVKYYNIDPFNDIEIKSICSDSFWQKTIAFEPFYINTMTLGYPKSTDTERILKLEHKGIEIRTGNPELGAEPGKLYFVILHGKKITT
jgi:hypothetical protein